MGSSIKKYHLKLARYFQSKPLYLDEPTQKKPNTRKLVEQPWQQTKAEMWDVLTKTLSDLLFIEAKCKGHKLYELLHDIDSAEVLSRIPALAYVRQAIVSSLLGLALWPEHFLPMLWNRVRWSLPPNTTPPGIFSNLERAYERLLGNTVWLKAIASLQETRKLMFQEFPIDNMLIQSLDMPSKTLAVLNKSFDIEILNIETGELKSRQYSGNHNITCITHSEDGQNVAKIDQAGDVFFNTIKCEVKARSKECLIEIVSGEVIFIDQENCLSAWNPSDNIFQVLLKDIVVPVILLRKSKESAGVLFVAGYRKQVCGVAILDSQGWSVKLLSGISSPIVAGDIDLHTGMIALASSDSIISIIDIEKDQCLYKWAYQYETGSNLRGMAVSICFGKGPTKVSIFIATKFGQVWNWNYSNGQTSSFGCYKQRKESVSLTCMGVWEKSGLPFVCTGSKAQTLVPENNGSIISQPVTNISFIDNKQVVSLKYESHTIDILNANGLSELEQISFPFPVTAVHFKGSDYIWVGGHGGVIGKISLGKEKAVTKTVTTANPVIGICKSKNEDKLWVAHANGDISPFRTSVSGPLDYQNSTDVLWSSNGSEKRIKVLPASENDTFWCLSAVENKPGRSVSLIYERNQAIELTGKYIISDIAVSEDHQLFATTGDSIEIYNCKNEQWTLLYSCEEPSKHIAFLENCRHIVTTNGRWLIVREIGPGLPIVSVHDMVSRINCISTSERFIAIGTQSGDVSTFVLELKMNI